MWPLVSKGDKIYIKYKNFKDLRIGDIILYNNTEFVLHRISKINNQKLVTKGDNNKKSDSQKVKKSDYLGVLYQIEKSRINFILKEPFLIFYFKYILPLHPLLKTVLKKIIKRK